MLYKLVDGQDCFVLNPELKAIPEFLKCTDRQFKVVALTADRRSPLRSLPDKQRREKACHIAGYGMEGNRPDRNAREIIAGKNETIERAILKYKEYQFDENEETLKTVESQIQEIKDYLKSDKTGAKDYGKALEQAAKLGEKLPSLIEAKQKLEQLLNISTEHKPEVTTYTSYDYEDMPESEDNLSEIDKYMMRKQKKEE